MYRKQQCRYAGSAQGLARAFVAPAAVGNAPTCGRVPRTSAITRPRVSEDLACTAGYSRDGVVRKATLRRPKHFSAIVNVMISRQTATRATQKGAAAHVFAALICRVLSGRTQSSHTKSPSVRRGQSAQILFDNGHWLMISCSLVSCNRVASRSSIAESPRPLTRIFLSQGLYIEIYDGTFCDITWSSYATSISGRAISRTGRWAKPA